MALSLILAMLLFKPAPIYILDEVDAALDLSHTQNIGQMLRTHFTHSQVRVSHVHTLSPHTLWHQCPSRENLSQTLDSNGFRYITGPTVGLKVWVQTKAG